MLENLKKAYPKIKRTKWLFGERDFLEFEVNKLGVGIYSVPLKKVILTPGAYSMFEHDKAMGWITCLKAFGSKRIIMNYSGQEIDFGTLR